MARNSKNTNRSWFNWGSSIHAEQSVEKTGRQGEGSKGQRHCNPVPEREEDRRFESDAEAERLKAQIKKTVKPPCPQKTAEIAALILRKIENG